MNPYIVRNRDEQRFASILSLPIESEWNIEFGNGEVPIRGPPLLLMMMMMTMIVTTQMTKMNGKELRKQKIFFEKFI